MTAGVLIDTNVLIDLTDPDAEHHAWANERVREAVDRRHACINPLIYAEVSARYPDPADLDNLLNPAEFHREELPYAAAYPAMQAFLEYRARGGAKTTCLPDFFIGAHAQVNNHTLLTRDARRFRTSFSGITLITPES